MVAGGAVLLSLVTIVFGQPWLMAVVAYGFIACVLDLFLSNWLHSDLRHKTSPTHATRYCGRSSSSADCSVATAAIRRLQVR